MEELKIVPFVVVKNPYLEPGQVVVLNAEMQRRLAQECARSLTQFFAGFSK